MKLINIFPVANLQCGFHQDYQMLLTHLIEKYPQYKEYAQTCNGYKILDNSLIELGGSVELSRVIKAADEINADEIILPDVFRDGKKTVESVESSLKELSQLGYMGRYKTMAVVHGKDIDEWRWCYDTLSSYPEVDVLGIPKVCAKMHPEGRPFFVNQICRTKQKIHHLLGLWYSYSEFKSYNNEKLDDIRTCDTCLTSFFTSHHLPADATRPDGWTIDLETEELDDITLLTYIATVNSYLSKAKINFK